MESISGKFAVEYVIDSSSVAHVRITKHESLDIAPMVNLLRKSPYGSITSDVGINISYDEIKTKYYYDYDNYAWIDYEEIALKCPKANNSCYYKIPDSTKVEFVAMEYY